MFNCYSRTLFEATDAQVRSHYSFALLALGSLDKQFFNAIRVQKLMMRRVPKHMNTE